MKSIASRAQRLLIFRRLSERNMRIERLLLLSCLLCPGVTWGQEASNADDIREGHRLAAEFCSICHLATPDQAFRPMSGPRAPPFATIVRRKDFTSEWLANFLKTTHRGLDEPNGMANPDLADFQIKQIVAYMMSVRQQ
jgi:mono/diheme cytochrome c family protein